MDKKKKKKPVKKAKKPRPKKREASEWEDDCFECGEEEGDLVMCDYPNCPKVYHLACLKVNKVPHGSWWCPYHVCDECSAKAVQFCAFCSSSCCRRHPDVLRAYSSSSMMCSRHDEFDTLPARSCLWVTLAFSCGAIALLVLLLSFFSFFSSRPADSNSVLCLKGKIIVAVTVVLYLAIVIRCGCFATCFLDLAIL